ncbi:hypothetical protein M2444_001173 [Paenibacillus sp. PastF-3]|nr:hypothetical protein [Paenibacillus sp. PastF-3]
MYFSTIFKIIKKGPDGVLGVNQSAGSVTLLVAYYSVFHIHSARLRYWRHIVFDFSHTFGSFMLLSVHCIRFFAYIRLVYVTSGILYSIFRIHLARLRYLRHIVFGFSHTFGSFTLPAAHRIRFFAYIRLVYVTGGTSYSIFRIHSARLRYQRHIVFGFPHTFSSFTLPVAHCIRFFAYIWLVYVTGGTLYSIFRIHLARLRYHRYIVFDFSHTFGSFTLLAAHCIRFFAYIWLVYVTSGTLYSVFRIHSAHLRYRRHIVFDISHTFGSFTYRKLILFDFSHTFGSFMLLSVHCIRFFAYIRLVYVTGGHCIRFSTYICP